jgi:hypothetical protein
MVRARSGGIEFLNKECLLPSRDFEISPTNSGMDEPNVLDSSVGSEICETVFPRDGTEIDDLVSSRRVAIPAE